MLSRRSVIMVLKCLGLITRNAGVGNLISHMDLMEDVIASNHKPLTFSLPRGVTTSHVVLLMNVRIMLSGFLIGITVMT